MLTIPSALWLEVLALKSVTGIYYPVSSASRYGLGDQLCSTATCLRTLYTLVQEFAHGQSSFWNWGIRFWYAKNASGTSQAAEVFEVTIAYAGIWTDKASYRDIHIYDCLSNVAWPPISNTKFQTQYQSDPKQDFCRCNIQIERTKAQSRRNTSSWRESLQTW